MSATCLHHLHPNPTRPIRCSAAAPPAKQRLLSLISDQDRGVKTRRDPARLGLIVAAIDELEATTTTNLAGAADLSATWRLMWTTEKEQLFIIENAPRLFGTRAGDVLQVIEAGRGRLSNVITFPPDGVFFVRSWMEVAPPRRVNFRFTGAVLRGKGWELPLPPVGKGWFDTVYLDDQIRVAKDIRGDYLVVDRAPYDWTE